MDAHNDNTSLPSNPQELYNLIHTLAAEVRDLKAHRDRNIPYSYAEPEAPLQKLVFDETREALYPNGISAAKEFYKRPDSSSTVIASTTAEISRSLRTLPQNPHQVYSAPAAFEKFPDQSREKKVDTALSSLQTHLSHLTRPIDHMAFEAMEHHRDWSYRDEHGNINEGLEGYDSVEDFANHIHEFYEQRTMDLLASLNDYRGYLTDLSHRISDIRLNLTLSAIGLNARQKPAETAPLYSLEDIKEIKDEQKLLKSLVESVQKRDKGRNKGGRNFTNNGSNTNNNSGNNGATNNGNNNNSNGSFSQSGRGGRGGSRGGRGRGGWNNPQGNNNQTQPQQQSGQHQQQQHQQQTAAQ